MVWRGRLALCCAILEQSGTEVERAVLVQVSLRDGSTRETDIGFDADAGRALIDSRGHHLRTEILAGPHAELRERVGRCLVRPFGSLPGPTREEAPE